MKTYRHTKIYMLLAAVLLAACDSSDIAEDMGSTDKGVMAQFTADISDTPTTRAIDGTWNADTIGVTATDAEVAFGPNMNYWNRQYKTTTVGSGTATFTPVNANDTIYIQDRNGEVTFTAYAPFLTGHLKGTNLDVSTANGDTDSQETIDFMTAKGSCTVQNPTVNFRFNHIMSKLVLQINVEESSCGLDDLTYELCGLVNTGTVYVDTTSTKGTFGTATPTGTAAEWDITNCVQTESGGVRTYSLIVFPQDLSRTGMYIRLSTTDGRIFSTIVSPNLRPGEKTTYSLALKEEKLTVEGSTISDWNEPTYLTGTSAKPCYDLSTVGSEVEIDEDAIITGTSTEAKKLMITGTNPQITLIDATFADNSQIEVQTTATLVVKGKNTLKTTWENGPAILVTGGTQSAPHTLTINGTDNDVLEITLEDGRGTGGIVSNTAYSHICITGGNIKVLGEYAYTSCGIGGFGNGNAGNITITGGIVYAEAHSMSAPIGFSEGCKGGDITISGSATNVTAMAKGSGACIGAAKSGGNPNEISECGNIVINGGATVNASVYREVIHAVGIGAGESVAKCGNITISGATTTVTATGGDGYYDIGATGDSTSCGTVTISDGATVKRNDGGTMSIYGH